MEKQKKQKKQKKQPTASKAENTVKNETAETVDNSPVTPAEIRLMHANEMAHLDNIFQVLSTIEELLKDIRDCQPKWPFQLNDHGYNDKPGWDRNTTPPDDPPSTIRWPAHPPCGPRWPTDPWGNPAPYAVYCDHNERMR